MIPSTSVSEKRKLTNMKLPIIACIVLLPFTYFSQEPHVFDWAKNFGGTSDETSYSIAADLLGNVFVTGSFDGTADFDPGSGISELTSNGDLDIFVAKYDPLGNFIWAVNFGGSVDDEGLDLAVDSSGNVCVTGYFQENVDFQPGSGTTNLNNQGDYDIFVVKLDGTGSLIWAKSMGGSDEEIGQSIFLDDQNNVYTTGHFAGTADFKPGGGSANLSSDGGTDIFVSKLNSNGSYGWAKRMGGGSNDISYSIALDTFNNVYCSGYFMGIADFDPGAGTASLASSGSFEAFVSKLNANGDYVWAKKLGGTGADFGKSVAVDDKCNVYSVGYFQGTGDFDPDSGVVNLTSGGVNDVYVSKLDSMGNYAWAHNFGSIHNDFAFSIDVDRNGKSYTTGYFRGVVDFDPGTAFNPLYAGGINEVFLLALDEDGNYRWAYSMGGTGGDYGRAVDVDDAGNVYTTGYFQGTGDFEPGTGTTNLTSAGSFDAFMQKLIPCENTTTLNPMACYSYTSPSGNYVWDTSGTYTDTLTNQHGCDSVITINLTVDSTDVTSIIYDTTCTNYISPDGSEVWDTTGTYMDTLINSYGCDSIITIYLTVDPSALTSVIYDTTCTNYVSPSGIYVWDSTGTYLDSITSVEGCDSVITIHLFVDSIPITSVIYDTACSSYVSPSGNYIWDSTNTYLDSLVSFEGCDSLVTVHLTIDTNSIFTSFMSVTACTSYVSPSGNYLWDSSNIYTDTIPSVQGCDSVITIDLTIDTNAIFTSTIEDTACFSYISPSGNYIWTSSATYTDTIPNVQGCDSIITIQLTVDTVNVGVMDSIHTLTAEVSGATYQWLNCDSNYIAITGETNQSFTATQNGNYAVLVTENGCSDTSSCYTIFSIAIPENDFQNEITISPNPTSGKCFVDLGQHHKNLTVSIVNIFGQIIHTETYNNTERLELDINGAPGYYLIQLTGDQSGTANIKILKQ
jgi:hypothetical protein